MGKGRGQPGAEGRWSQLLGSRGPVCPVAVGSSQPCSLPAPTWWCGLGSPRLADSVMGPPLVSSIATQQSWEVCQELLSPPPPGREPEVHRGASIGPVGVGP